MSTEEKLADILADMAVACEDQIDTNFRDCMIDEAYQRRDLECAPRVYLVASEGCQGCAEAKEELGKLIEDGQVEVLDSESEKGYTLLRQTEHEGTVPSLVIADCDGNLIGEMEIYPQEEEDGR